MQDQDHNLWGPVQNENVESLFERVLRISGWQQQSIQPSMDPSEYVTLCACTGPRSCGPDGLALLQGLGSASTTFHSGLPSGLFPSRIAQISVGLPSELSKIDVIFSCPDFSLQMCLIALRIQCEFLF